MTYDFDGSWDRQDVLHSLLGRMPGSHASFAEQAAFVEAGLVAWEGMQRSRSWSSVVGSEPEGT